MRACSAQSGSRGVGFIALMPVLYFSLKTQLGISLQESLFLSHTHAVVCASGRGLLSESLVGASKQLLPNLSKGFRSCRIIETVVVHVPQPTLRPVVALPSAGLHQPRLGLQGTAAHGRHLPVPGFQQTQAEGRA